jgi:thioester reductase-like protein
MITIRPEGLELSPLTVAEHLLLLQTWNSAQQDSPQHLCSYQLFEQQAAATPERKALRHLALHEPAINVPAINVPAINKPALHEPAFNEPALHEPALSLTYRELNQQANQLAHYLQSLGVGPEKLVGVCLERSPLLIVTLLAILKAGGAYLLVDAADSTERIHSVIEASQIAVLVTQFGLLGHLPFLNTARLVNLDRDRPLIDQQSCANLNSRGPGLSLRSEPPTRNIERRSRFESRRPSLERPDPAPRTPLEAQLVKLWSQVLPAEAIGVHDSFLDLGGDSMLAVQLLRLVNQELAACLEVGSFLAQPTVAAMAYAITRYREDQATCDRALAVLNLQKEAVLDPTIRAEVPFAGLKKTERILLTGATGFLGAFLLHELLDTTAAQIYCLVRAKGAEAGRRKILSNLERYHLDHRHHLDRIVIVAGNLDQDQLGLKDPAFNQLAEQIDAIYHNGALVNRIYPYSALKSANVLGTREVLRLAGRTRTKPVYFISTLDVLHSCHDTQLPVRLENDPLQQVQGLDSGYAQSKWVAEHLILQARDRGIPTSTFRPGLMVGHSHSGASRGDDVVCRILKGLVQLGSAPRLDAPLMLTPVDYVSRAIVHIASQERSLNQVFHLVTPYTLPWQQWVEGIRAAGFDLEMQDDSSWQQQLMHRLNDVSLALHPLIERLVARGGSQAPLAQLSLLRQPFDSANTQTALAHSSIHCPEVTRRSVETYCNYLIHSGWIEAPETKA